MLKGSIELDNTFEYSRVAGAMLSAISLIVGVIASLLQRSAQGETFNAEKAPVPLPPPKLSRLDLPRESINYLICCDIRKATNNPVSTVRCQFS